MYLLSNEQCVNCTRYIVQLPIVYLLKTMALYKQQGLEKKPSRYLIIISHILTPFLVIS